MTISNILEHWASIYKPLSHKPESERLEDQSFFRIRYIDLENIFSRNANIVHSPCMTLGRYDGNKIERTANDLTDYCKDLIAWLIEVKRTGRCPHTQRSFADDAVVMAELQSIDTSSISFGLVGDIYAGQWLVVGMDWKSLQPLYNFACGSNGKYIVPKEDLKG